VRVLRGLMKCTCFIAEMCQVKLLIKNNVLNFTGKNLYTNEHVAIKLVSPFKSVIIFHSLCCSYCRYSALHFGFDNFYRNL